MNGVNYAWPVSSINRDDLTAFEKWYKLYEEKISPKKIYVWGAGIRGTEFGVFIKRYGNENFEYIDNNPEKIGGHIDGKPIVPFQAAIEEVLSDRAIILISVENCNAIIEQLESNKMIHNVHFFIAPGLEYDNYVKEFVRKSKCDNIIMGDCMFSGISLSDSDSRNLSEMIKDNIGENNCKILYMHGMGIRSYYNILKLYCENYGFPKCLEIMINFETLTGKQHLLPRSQHSELFHMLNKEIEIVNDEFKEYIGIVDSRSENFNVEISHNSAKLTAEQEQYLKNRNYLKINYMYDLDVETEGIVYLKKLSEYVKIGETKIIAYIPPVNYQLGYDIFKESFDDAYNNNLSKIKHIMKEINVELLDFSHIFTKEYFAELDTIDESLNEKGRKIMMEKLCENLMYTNNRTLHRGGIR